jgi:hypothetical protein
MTSRFNRDPKVSQITREMWRRELQEWDDARELAAMTMQVKPVLVFIYFPLWCLTTPLYYLFRALANWDWFWEQ